jgi:catechol 2,3-dioxygenase-like lactoylglutathione lyase family enzyme
MLGDCDLVAFVSTADAARARQFYVDTLGLTVLEVTPYACVVDAKGTTLRITVVAEVVVAPYTVLGWTVRDITATVRELAARGTSLVRYDGMEQDHVGVWTSPSGARVAWFRDPDGNTLSITQM